MAASEKKFVLTFWHKLLCLPTLWLWMFGIMVGWFVGPIIHGFRVGLIENKKFWDYPDEFK